jgi:hypothetical protein
MSNVAKVLLIFAGVILVIGLLFAAMFFAITMVVRQTTADALAPITNTSRSIETRVAQFLNPTPTIIPNPITIIHDVRSLARLETIQYTMEKVITAEEGQDTLSFLFGDRLLFVGHGRVIAGIDMAKLRPEDMWVEGQVLYMRLPPAEIFVVTLDNERSYVYDRSTGLLRQGDINLERAARIAAENEILNAAVEDGILNQAQQNAESYMMRLLRSLGYPDVIFVNGAPAPTATPQP